MAYLLALAASWTGLGARWLAPSRNILFLCFSLRRLQFRGLTYCTFPLQRGDSPNPFHALLGLYWFCSSANRTSRIATRDLYPSNGSSNISESRVAYLSVISGCNFIGNAATLCSADKNLTLPHPIAISDSHLRRFSFLVSFKTEIV